jgi:phosphonate C-P lyase system protein PhnG
MYGNDLHTSEVAAEADLVTIRAIADVVADAVPVSLVREPAGAMIMVRNVDPVGLTPFCLGEAHVTECEVEVDGVLGYGCVLGDSAERALCAAIIDAIVASEHPVRAEVERRLADAAAAIVRSRRAESNRTAATRVDFDLK